jgi:BolA-like protein
VFQTPKVSTAVYTTAINLIDSDLLTLRMSNLLVSQARLATRAAVKMSSTGPVYDAIETKLSAGLSPAHLQVINESHMHSGPATESHFKVKFIHEHG